MVISDVENNLGKKLSLVLSKENSYNGRTRYDFNLLDDTEKEIGTFEFDVPDGEEYANIEYSKIDHVYQGNGLYKEVLEICKKFFKDKGLKGIFTDGRLRNASSNNAWNKILNKKEIQTRNDVYKDYVFEHLKTFEDFKETEYTVYDNTKGGKFYGDKGAGVLIISKDTGKILVAKRSEEVNEPGTFGIFGGKMEDGETPKQAAKRELEEESGYEGHYEIIPAYVFKSDDKTFTYFNFIGLVDAEFEPSYDWETEYAEWISFKEFINIEPKHFGLDALIKNSLNIIKKHSK